MAPGIYSSPLSWRHAPPADIPHPELRPVAHHIVLWAPQANPLPVCPQRSPSAGRSAPACPRAERFRPELAPPIGFGRDAWGGAYSRPRPLGHHGVVGACRGRGRKAPRGHGRPVAWPREFPRSEAGPRISSEEPRRPRAPARRTCTATCYGVARLPTVPLTANPHSGRSIKVCSSSPSHPGGPEPRSNRAPHLSLARR